MILEGWHLRQSRKPEDLEAEVVTAAALRYKGQIYSGTLHTDALDALWNANPSERGQDVPAEYGFVTSKGRFLTRAEATDLVAKTGQLKRKDEA